MRRGLALLGLVLLTGCGGKDAEEAAPATATPVAERTLRVEFRDPGTRGRATADLTQDLPSSCSVGSVLELRAGPDEVGPGRSADKLRLSSGTITDGKGTVRGQKLIIGGAGPLAVGATGTVALRDRRSGTVTFAEDDVRITFTC